MPADSSKSPTDPESPTVKMSAEEVEELVAKGRLKLPSELIDRLEYDSDISLPMDLAAPFLKKRECSSPIEWMEPLDAVHLLAPKFGGDAAAKLVIAERLRDGAIKCSHVWMSDGPDIGPLSSKRPKFPTLGQGTNLKPWVTPINRGINPTMLERAFWQRSNDWDADLKKWNWSAGLFTVSYRFEAVVEENGIPIKSLKSKMPLRMVASGVRFSRYDIARIVEIESSSVLDQSPEIPDQSNTGKRGKRGKTGPRPKKFQSALILRQLESQIISGEILRFGLLSSYGTKAQIEREIARLFIDLYDVIPSESTIRRMATRLMSDWERHQLNEIT